MSEYDDWKQENDRWEAYLYPNGVLRNKLGITKAAKWHKTECEFVAARNNDLRPNTGLTTGNVGEELFAGTTSACAENTALAPHGLGKLWNYLRVRGEYGSSYMQRPPAVELPPRARRILLKASTRRWKTELPPRARRIRPAFPARCIARGTTSACAENTPPKPSQSGSTRNYLRVRGEYFSWSS